MLFNPDWKKSEKSDPSVDHLSLNDFIVWLETHNPDKVYNFSAMGGNCLMGQYMAARGISWGKGMYGPSCRQVLHNNRGEGFVLATHPFTFGAALTRAKQFQETHGE